MKVLRLLIDDKDLQSFGTLSGFLCHKAGCIPPVGTQILVSYGVPALCRAVLCRVRCVGRWFACERGAGVFRRALLSLNRSMGC